MSLLPPPPPYSSSFPLQSFRSAPRSLRSCRGFSSLQPLPGSPVSYPSRFLFLCTPHLLHSHPHSIIAVSQYPGIPVSRYPSILVSQQPSSPFVHYLLPSTICHPNRPPLSSSPDYSPPRVIWPLMLLFLECAAPTRSASVVGIVGIEPRAPTAPFGRHFIACSAICLILVHVGLPCLALPYPFRRRYGTFFASLRLKSVKSERHTVQDCLVVGTRREARGKSAERW